MPTIGYIIISAIVVVGVVGLALVEGIFAILLVENLPGRRAAEPSQATPSPRRTAAAPTRPRTVSVSHAPPVPRSAA
jgi:hypothetical protein